MTFPGKELAGQVIDAAISAADPCGAVKANLSLKMIALRLAVEIIHLQSNSKIITGGIGQGRSGDDVQLRSRSWGTVIPAGCAFANTLMNNSSKTQGLYPIIGNHPVPGEGSLEAGRAIRKVVGGLSAQDFVLLLLSGGGSALATLPVNGIGFSDLQILTGALLRSGATINEINCVRKHLDLIKGGGLLRLAAPAKVAALVLSDVVGNPLDVIASGPAVP